MEKMKEQGVREKKRDEEIERSRKREEERQ